jgi:hypothetical protein
MSFLNPLLLWGLAGIAVPIVIHLMFRRQVQRVVWAAMRFLQVSLIRHKQRLRIEDLLLLLLRCLLVVLLALALARPTSRGVGAAFAAAYQPMMAVLVIDNSASMSQTDGVSSRFEKAKLAAEQIIDAMPAGSSTALYLASDTAEGVVAEPSHDLNLLRKSIREAPLSDRGSDLLPAFQRAVDTLRTHSAGRKILYCLGDRQALAWRHAADIQKLLEENRATIRTRVVFAGMGDEENLAVTGLKLAGGLPTVGQSLRCDVEVTNFGRENRVSVPVRIAVDDNPPTDEAVLESVPPNTTKSVSLFVKLPDAGFHTVIARLTPDHLPADDQRTMVVVARKRFDVLLVDGQPGRSPQESPVFYLRGALQPVTTADIGEFFVKTTTVTVPELDAKRLDDFDVVFFADVPELPEPVLPALEQYLRRGGNAVFFLGPDVRADYYNTVLLGKHALLPSKLGEVRGDSRPEAENWFSLQSTKFDHPVVALWNDPAAGKLDSARFFQAFKLDLAAVAPGTPAGRSRVMLKFNDKDKMPAVTERTWGAGRVVMFASSANTVWNDLPVRPAFVPLLFRMLGWMVAEQTHGLNVGVGERFTYRTRDELANNNVTVDPPPAGKAARGFSRVDIVNGVPLVRFDRTDWSGAYHVLVQSEPPTAMAFAAQPSPAESDLVPMSTVQQQALRSVVDFVEWKSGDSWRESGEAAALRGNEWWRPLLLAVLLVATVEMILGYWFSRSK